jgi:hypothetical protein
VCVYGDVVKQPTQRAMLCDSHDGRLVVTVEENRLDDAKNIDQIYRKTYAAVLIEHKR